MCKCLYNLHQILLYKVKRLCVSHLILYMFLENLYVSIQFRNNPDAADTHTYLNIGRKLALYPFLDEKDRLNS